MFKWYQNYYQFQIFRFSEISVECPYTQPDGTLFFLNILTWEVDLIEILEITPQMWQYVIFLSLKQTKVTSTIILN